MVQHHSHNAGTALPVAALFGHLKVVEILLDYGSDINSSGRNGTGLQAAAAIQGNPDLVKMLLGHGADLESQCPNGSVLKAAVSKGHLKTAE